MIPVPSSGSHDRCEVAKKPLQVLTSVNGLNVLTAVLKPQYVLTVTIL